ncbi:hypothetical protein SSX86_003575 [Deinandra increscens subsp. villosa]|uniref:O-methyltransferase n=1 Tax=Deinandra increscens subsp. villosa TaxID=3103831 RepID=A0AAP0H6X0_9ASTR
MNSEIKIDKNISKGEELAPHEEMLGIILGFIPLAVVKCAIDLGIPDILDNHESPMTLDDLASQLKCPKSSLYRIMRFLIRYNVFQEKPIISETVGYTQSPLSRLLTRSGKHSVTDIALLQSSPVMMAPWNTLSAWISGKGDSSPFEAAHGTDVWGFFAANPSHIKPFNDGMACDARAAVTAVIEGCPEVFSGLRTLVDVGGADGAALRSIVEACPWINGINFDLPHVVSEAQESVGVQHVGGNMFDYVPKADAVYLMKVLHDWADDECIAILRRCREAIPQDTGKVIVVDAVLGREEDHKINKVGLMLDMAMMTYTSKGKERTYEEWAYVFYEAGFTRFTIKHIQIYHSVIEVYP